MVDVSTLKAGQVVALSCVGFCAVVSGRWMRGGHTKVTLAPLAQGPKLKWYEVTYKHAAQLERLSDGQHVDRDVVAAAIKKVSDAIAHKSVAVAERTEARRDAIGAINWDKVDFRGVATETANFKVGDVIIVNPDRPADRWEAIVAKINPATGKLGIRRHVSDARRVQDTERALAHELFAQLDPERGARRRPRGASDVRWIDSRYARRAEA